MTRDTGDATDDTAGSGTTDTADTTDTGEPDATSEAARSVGPQHRRHADLQRTAAATDGHPVVLLFALQGEAITSRPIDVGRIALPLIAYFAIMWTVAFWVGKRVGLGYKRNATLAFTAAGNNFELAIAVAIGVFGATSGQALAGVAGPLIEVPALVGLVYVSLWARQRFYPSATEQDMAS